MSGVSDMSDMRDIIGIIEREYYTFDIEQLVDVINEIFDDGGGGRGRVFFEADPSLAFPSSDISSVSIDAREGLAVVTLPVMNLLGVSSPLPIKFSDYITRDSPDADFYRDFLSIMQNRLHGLWLDAQRKYAHWGAAASVAGAVFESMRAGGSASLKLLIRSAWSGIAVSVEENVERWALADNVRALGDGLRLGRNAIAGTRVMDRTSKFRVSLGPLEFEMYRTFLPGEGNYTRLQGMVASCLRGELLVCELEVLCRQGSLSPARTGEVCEGRLGRTMRLGGPAADGRVHRYRVLLPVMV